MIGLLICVTDCWQQFLACPLHGTHIPPDHGFLQPVHIHEWSESTEWCADVGVKTAGGRAAWGKSKHSFTTVQRLKSFKMSSQEYSLKVQNKPSLEGSWKTDKHTAVWLYNSHQAIGLYLLVYASRLSLSFTLVIQHSPPRPGSVFPSLPPVVLLFLWKPLAAVICCYGDNVQIEGEREREGIETKNLYVRRGLERGGGHTSD